MNSYCCCFWRRAEQTDDELELEHAHARNTSNFPILCKHEKEIAEKTRMDMGPLLMFFQDKKMITHSKAEEFKRRAEDNSTTMYNVIQYLKTRGDESTIVPLFIEAMRYVGNKYMADKLQADWEGLEMGPQAQGTADPSLIATTSTDSFAKREVERMNQENEALKQELRQVTERFRHKMETSEQEKETLGQANERFRHKMETLGREKKTLEQANERFRQEIGRMTEEKETLMKEIERLRTDAVSRNEKQRAEHIELDNIPPCTSNASATNGALLCIGGYGPGSKSIEVYTKTSDRWILIDTEMNTKRKNCGAVLVGSKIYALGGVDESRNDLRSMEILDIPSGKWSEGEPMPNERWGLGVAYLDGDIYAVGGRHNYPLETVDKYNIASRKWTPVAPMQVQRYGTKVVALGGYLFAIGGHDGSHTLSSCERYDPRLDAWTPIAPMRQGRWSPGVAVLDGCIYAIGGHYGGCRLSSCERYTPSTDTWQDIPPMSCERGYLGVAVLDNKIYAVGGKGTSGTAECYDPKTDKWSGIASLNNGRWDHELVCCDVPDHVLHELRK